MLIFDNLSLKSMVNSSTKKCKYGADGTSIIGQQVFFKQTLAQGIPVGSIIEITVTRPDGTPITANMRVQESDMELLQEIKEIATMNR